jgi:hypothetical protein
VSAEEEPSRDNDRGVPVREIARTKPSVEPAEVTLGIDAPDTVKVPANVPATTIGPPASATDALEVLEEDDNNKDHLQEPDGENLAMNRSDNPVGVRLALHSVAWPDMYPTTTTSPSCATVRSKTSSSVVEPVESEKRSGTAEDGDGVTGSEATENGDDPIELVALTLKV